MQVDGKTITFEKSLWVQFGGVEVSDDGERVALVGRDEDSFLKVFNHFGRVLKLFVMEGERWIDTDTGQPAQSIDLSQAGHVGAAMATGAPAPGATSAATPAAEGAQPRSAPRRGRARASASPKTAPRAKAAGQDAPRGKAKSPRAPSSRGGAGSKSGSKSGAKHRG